MTTLSSASFTNPMVETEFGIRESRVAANEVYALAPPTKTDALYSDVELHDSATYAEPTIGPDGKPSQPGDPTYYEASGDTNGTDAPIYSRASGSETYSQPLFETDTPQNSISTKGTGNVTELESEDYA